MREGGEGQRQFSWINFFANYYKLKYSNNKAVVLRRRIESCVQGLEHRKKEAEKDLNHPYFLY